MSEVPIDPAPDERRIPGFCALCRSRCGCVSVVHGGRLVAVEPDPEHPTGQALCAKGRAAPELVYSPDRLMHPMKRTKPKGAVDPGWERITWDEALRTVAERLDVIRQERGPEAVAFSVTTPSGTAMSDAIQWVERLIRGFGSPNTVYGTEICNWHKDHATAFTFGVGVGAPDYERAGCILHWGHNPNTSWLVHAERTSAAKARGAKLIVVDPRRAGGAVKADQWLRVRPGYDGALALGLANVMIENGWYDAAFMKGWTTGPFLIDPESGRFVRASAVGLEGPQNGFVAWDLNEDRPVVCDPSSPSALLAADLALTGRRTIGAAEYRTAFDLYAELAAGLTPERVEHLAWVPAAEVVEAAQMIGSSGPVAYYAWSGVGQHTNATQTDRAIALLYALTGSYDAPGGNLVHAKVPVNDVSGRELISPEQKAKGLELDLRPIGPGTGGWVTADGFYRAVLDGAPYQVEALVSFGTNMLISHPDGDRGARALEALDFHVHADMVLNPSAVYADIVLPVCSAWERDGLRVGFEIDQAAEELVQLRAPTIAPVGESRADTWIVFELAKRLGLGELFWDGDCDAALVHLLEPSGVSLETLRETPEGVRVGLMAEHRKYAGEGAAGFATPSRRVEVYSETFLDHGQAPLPEFVPPPQSKDLPLVLTSAKSPLFCHSQFRNLPSLRRRAPHPVAELHPEAAGARDIQNGDWIEIETDKGRMRAIAKLSGSLDPRVVVAQQGWWQGCTELGLPGYDTGTDGGGNYNAMIGTEVVDPISGSVPLRAASCEVRAVRVMP